MDGRGDVKRTGGSQEGDGHDPGRKGRKRPDTPVETGVPEPELWKLADTLRGNIDAAEYKHIVLPLIFLKYISDAFEELHQELESKADEGYDPEQPDEYAERNVFWVPMEARWSNIQSKARQEDIGAIIDRAMDVIERDNKPLQGVFPKNYGLSPRPSFGGFGVSRLARLSAGLHGFGT